MKFFLHLIPVLVMLVSAYVQSILSACAFFVITRRKLSTGTETDVAGSYVCDFKDGKRNGQGQFSKTH